MAMDQDLSKSSSPHSRTKPSFFFRLFKVKGPSQKNENKSRKKNTSASNTSYNFDKEKELSKLPRSDYQGDFAADHTSIQSVIQGNEDDAYSSFLHEFPEYKSTSSIDIMRETEYTRLKTTGETYVDYMGGALYPESLVRRHSEFLLSNVLGNTHSVSNSSMMSLKFADEARRAVLNFFCAPPEYTVIFTPNASGALKLVGESFPFCKNSSLVLGVDAHNSVHGVREFANSKNAKTFYIPCTSTGGFDIKIAESVLQQNRPSRSKASSPALFILTAQSNVSNTKNPLSILAHASTLGYSTLLDAAALAPTSTLSLSEFSADAVAVSFYKMFGFPTGVGALIAKKSLLEKLRRPWFAGGTVDIAQVPGTIFTRAPDLHEQFEDGTINYLMLRSVTEGLKFLTPYLTLLPLRLSCLTSYLFESLSSIRHDTSGAPVVKLLSRAPLKRLRNIGDQADYGSTISMVYFWPSGELMSNKFIEYAASKLNISLRTGCMCNFGVVAAMLGVEEEMQQVYDGMRKKDYECATGREMGVVRVSLGLASNFSDVWKVAEFTKLIATHRSVTEMWDSWIKEAGPSS